jgi:tripartite ATP-independent transporter DctM subunit
MIATLLLVCVVLGAIGVPLAFAMGLGSVAAITVQGVLPYEIIAQRTMNALESFPFIAVPMFILAGELMNTAGITDRLVRFCQSLVGYLKGGLGFVTVVASMFFSGISGSATADAAGLGKVLIPAMIRQKYDEDYAVCLVAAAATMGPIIPPSILMIVYSSMTNLSIGRLFMAGLFPGVTIGIALMIFAGYYARKRNYPSEPWLGIKELLVSAWHSFLPLMAPLVVIVGIVGGAFTATEAGTIVVIYTAALGFFYGELNMKKLYQVMVKAVESTTVVLFIIASASILGWLLVMGGFPAMVVRGLSAISSDVHVLLFTVVALLIFLGLFVDGMAILVTLTPVLHPVAQALGIDPIHFATLMVVCVMVGGITPPFGVLLFIACQVGGVGLEKVTRTIWKFVAVMMIVVFLVAYIPSLSTWLPNVLFN